MKYHRTRRKEHYREVPLLIRYHTCVSVAGNIYFVHPARAALTPLVNRFSSGFTPAPYGAHPVQGYVREQGARTYRRWFVWLTCRVCIYKSWKWATFSTLLNWLGAGGLEDTACGDAVWRHSLRWRTWFCFATPRGQVEAVNALPELDSKWAHWTGGEATKIALRKKWLEDLRDFDSDRKLGSASHSWTGRGRYCTKAMKSSVITVVVLVEFAVISRCLGGHVRSSTILRMLLFFALLDTVIDQSIICDGHVFLLMMMLRKC